MGNSKDSIPRISVGLKFDPDLGSIRMVGSAQRLNKPVGK